MSNHENSNHILKNKSNGNTKSQIQPELKLGEYFLTPLESFIINKKMPRGFKLELEENLKKLTESYNKDRKKNKKSKNLIKSTSYSYNPNNKLNNKIEKKDNTQIKKRMTQENHIDNIPNDVNREKYKIAKKCKIAIERIKDTPLAKNFYEFNDIETPSLSKVEKKLNNYEYTSFYDFEMDIRKIWSYFFYLGEKGDKEIYENTSKMSEKWENICSELDNANDDMFETISNSVIRRAEKNKKEIMDYKENGKDKINKGFTKKQDIIKNGSDEVYVNNKEELTGSMSGEEKNKLGNLIRNNLNMEQLKGLAKILMGKDNIKVLEFDIDQLPYDKLKKLEKYVNDCVKQNNNVKNNTNVSNTKNKNNHSNLDNKLNKKGKENEINNKNIKSNNNEKKELNGKNETNNNEIKDNKMDIKNDNIEKKNEEKENKKIINGQDNNNNINRQRKDSISDSLSSDSSLSD